jgi:hypothetical protein
MNKIVFKENEIEVISCFERDNRLFINVLVEEVDERLNELNEFDGILEYYEESTDGLNLLKFSNTFQNVQIKMFPDYYCFECFNSVEPTEEELAEMERQRKLSEIDSLKLQLAETDYIFIKAGEYQVLGNEPPYKQEYLHEISEERRAIRDRINLLEEEIEQSLGVE